jgi:hypothetical protein
LALAAVAALGLSACEEKKPAAAGDTTATSTSTAKPAAGLTTLTGPHPSSVTPKRPDANTGGDPKVPFKELVEVKKAKAAAEDKEVLIRGYVGQLREPGAFLDLYECEYRGDRILLQAKFAEGQIALVRGMPNHKPNGPCPRIHVKITGFDEKLGHPQGELVEVYDVQPDPLPLNLPAGVDFISIDDLFLRGGSAVGKVAEVPVKLDHKEDKGGVTHYVLQATGCSDHGGRKAHFFVPEQDTTRAALATVPKTPSCIRARFKITAAPTAEEPTRWGAELVAIGDKKFRAPEPVPNP